MGRRELNILFTCAGRRVALLRAFRSAMSKLGIDGKMIAADVTSASPAFHKADVGLLVPSVRKADYVESLYDHVRTHGVGLLVPLTDLDLPVLAQHREEFAKAGCTVMVGSPEAIDICRDKVRTSQIVGEAGLAQIRTLPLRDFLSTPFYPCFVKPTNGSASVGTRKIESEKELWTHVGAFGADLIVQEYVPGQEFTIDVYRSRDGQVRCLVPRQRLSVRSGEVVKGLTVRDQSLIDAAAALAGALGDLWGVFCCQCRRSSNDAPRFFEINPRFGGGAPLSIAAGCDLPLYLLQEVLGMPVTASLGEFADGLLMLRYEEAVFVPYEGDRSSLPGYDTPESR